MDHDGTDRSPGPQEVRVYIAGRGDYIRALVGVPRARVTEVLNSGPLAIPQKRGSTGKVGGSLRIDGKPVKIDDTPVIHGEIIRLDWVPD